MNPETIFLFTLLSVLAPSSSSDTPIFNFGGSDRELAQVEVEHTLLDIIRDAGGGYWNITTVPERNYMRYFNSSDQIDKTYLNTPVEFDLTPFNGAAGVWIFPHTFKFGEEHYAIFVKFPLNMFLHKLQIRGYLHENTELLYFSSDDDVTPSIIFRGNGEHGWEDFEVHEPNLINRFRLEIRTRNDGDFGFLDKVDGYFRSTWPTTTTTRRPTTTELVWPTTEPIISTTPEEGTCSSKCSCDCQCDCKPS